MADRSAPKTWRGRVAHYGLLLLVATGLLAAPVVLNGVAGAVHDDEFQLDGNTVDEAAKDEDHDWESILEEDDPGPGVGDVQSKATLPTGILAVGATPDYVLPDATTYTTGSKDILNISTGWDCTQRNNVGDKVDIVNSYSAVAEAADGDRILYFGTEVSSPNGSSNVAFWFLQDPDVGCMDAPGGGGTDFTGDHVDGDLLVVSAFSDGGRQANVSVYEWQGGANGFLDTTPLTSTGALCGAPGGDDRACAITNASDSITTPWNSPDKDGGALNAQEFFEGGVNLSELELPERCFATFLSNTRSSGSLTATIFDFTLGELESCEPSTSISVEADTTTVFAGDLVTLTMSETNDGNIELTEPTVGYVTTDNTDCAPADVDEVDNDDPTVETPDTFNDGDANKNGDLDPGETWLFECTFTPSDSITVTVFGHGIFDDGVNPPVDVTWVDACAGPDEDPETTDDNPESVDTDEPPDGVDDVLCDFGEMASIDITRLAPGTLLTKSASATITYTYTETNEGNAALRAPSDPDTLPGDFVDSDGDLVDPSEENGGWVVDDTCSPVLHVLGSDSDAAASDPDYNVGDVGDPAVEDNPATTDDEDPAENNNRLDPGETWVFTCEYQLAAPDESAEPPKITSSVTNTAVGHGVIDTDDTDAALDITWCEDPSNPPSGVRCDQDERDVATVTIEHGDHTTGLEE